MSISEKINPIIDRGVVKKFKDSLSDSTEFVDLKKNFLNLLVAQIKNQDPMHPIKNTELTSQLAQINTTSGIQDLNKNFLSFLKENNRNNTINATSIIGHGVIVPGSKILHTKNENTVLGLDLVGEADSIKLNITNENGDNVFSKELGSKNSGIHYIYWNGKNNHNEDLPNGKYYFSIKATKNGNPVSLQPLNYAVVKSVINSTNNINNDFKIDLGLMGISTISSVRKIF